MVPTIMVIAGPNGAGKSTSAPALVPPSAPFLNADEIAKELAGETGSAREVHAGRLFLEEWDRLTAQRASFAIETTLASRSLAPRIRRLHATGYRFELYFFWLPSPDLAVARVASRVRRGGHNIPEDVIRRRYIAGIENFLNTYHVMADAWQLFENPAHGQPHRIASGYRSKVNTVDDIALWTRLLEETAMPDRIAEMPGPYITRNLRQTERAIQLAVRAAVLDHKRAGNPIAEWRDGKVVIVPPEEIEVADIPDDIE